MIDSGKKNVLGVLIDPVDYETAVARTVAAATAGRPYAVSALAVHGVMTGVKDPEHRFRLNHFDLVTPDGQPVRWALNSLHKAGLQERVYGPTLTLKLCSAAAERGLPVYFYGSTREVLDRLASNLVRRFPRLEIAGVEVSKFRRTSEDEKQEIAQRVRRSGARMCFVGLGCPRQEVFVYEYRDLLSMPLVAVGAAFDYHAGLVNEPPAWVQDRGLQWAYRFAQDPRRLWYRYTILNLQFTIRFIGQKLGWWSPRIAEVHPSDINYG